MADRITACLRSIPLAAFESTLSIRRDVESVVDMLQASRCGWAVVPEQRAFDCITCRRILLGGSLQSSFVRKTVGSALKLLSKF